MMEQTSAPDNYEDLTRVIHEEFDNLSRSFQQIAIFVTQNPNEIAVLSVNALAERCGVHASSLVRFAQQFGYLGFKDLQTVFQARLATAAPGFEARMRALKSDLDAQTHHGVREFLGDLVIRDITSLEDLIANTPEKDLEQAITLLDEAHTIYLLGQLRSEPIVELLRYILTMLGRRTVLLDASGGLATHMAQVMQPTDLLFAVSFRFYATEVINIAEAASANEIPIVAISDSTLSPLAKCASVLFAVPEHEYTFSRTLAAPMCLAQALMMGLAAKVQSDANGPPRIPVVTQR